MPSNPLLIVIVGPTASGKSSLAMRAAHELGNAEIVSADSRQIYRGMDIGTAKPSVHDQTLVPHHLIDIKDPNEPYTVADYKRDASKAINDIIARNKRPLLVGGTGLYIKSVVENLDIPNIESDAELRTQLEKEIEDTSLEAVFAKLVTLDPEAENVVDRKNPRRVIRALEVAMITGEPFTAQRKKNPPLYSAVTVGINVETEILQQRINARIDIMMAEGLLKEVELLVKKYGNDASALNAIGYKELVDYINGVQTFDDAIAAIKMNTWHYAKRQMTWFKKDSTVQWADPVHGLKLILAEIKQK